MLGPLSGQLMLMGHSMELLYFVVNTLGKGQGHDLVDTIIGGKGLFTVLVYPTSVVYPELVKLSTNLQNRLASEAFDRRVNLALCLSMSQVGAASPSYSMQLPRSR